MEATGRLMRYGILIAVLAGLAPASGAAGRPAMASLPGDECAFVSAMLPEWRSRTRVEVGQTVAFVATAGGVGGSPQDLMLKTASWQALEDFGRKAANADLSACPGLNDTLAAYGWRLTAGRKAQAVSWQVGRIGFNADHTEAITWVEYHRPGFHHAWAAVYRTNATTGRWVQTEEGFGVIS